MMSAESSTPLHRHPRPHRELLRRYRHYASRQEFRISLLVSVVFALAAFGLNTFSIVFATEHASNPVTDIILSNTPVFDVDALFVYGTLIAALYTAALCLAHPKRLPFVLHTLTLFWVTRSLFVMMTHFAPFEPHAVSDFGTIVNRMFFGADLFFSGHTGLPFLVALLFWREKPIRFFYLAMAVFFAIIVLLGHLHYTIDVASAFFISYGIFHIAEWLFPKDRALFYSEMPAERL